MKLEVPFATMIDVCVESTGWPATAICSTDGPTAKVTSGPALCSASGDGTIMAPLSPEVELPAGAASMLTPLLEKVGLRVTPVTVVTGIMEASIIPEEPMIDVVEDPTTVT